MKVEKIKIPLEPEEFEYSSNPTLEEVKYLEDLIRQNKVKEFEDFINKKMIGRELDTPSPGLPTRDYLASALTKSIHSRYPELKDLNKYQQFKFLKNKVYPGLDEFKKAFDLSNEVDIEPYNDDTYSPSTGKIRLDEYGNNFLDAALHELAHSVDDPISKMKRYKERRFKPDNFENKEEATDKFLKLNPKLKKLMQTDTISTSDSEQIPLGFGKSKYTPIIRTPNYSDYDWSSGEFNSDTIGNPVDKYKEVGGEHHLDRPFSLDNFINFSKGDLKDIVKTEDRFGKLRKKLT